MPWPLSEAPRLQIVCRQLFLGKLFAGEIFHRLNFSPLEILAVQVFAGETFFRPFFSLELFLPFGKLPCCPRRGYLCAACTFGQATISLRVREHGCTQRIPIFRGRSGSGGRHDAGSAGEFLVSTRTSASQARAGAACDSAGNSVAAFHLGARRGGGSGVASDRASRAGVAAAPESKFSEQRSANLGARCTAKIATKFAARREAGSSGKGPGVSRRNRSTNRFAQKSGGTSETGNRAGNFRAAGSGARSETRGEKRNGAGRWRLRLPPAQARCWTWRKFWTSTKPGPNRREKREREPICAA